MDDQIRIASDFALFRQPSTRRSNYVELSAVSSDFFVLKLFMKDCLRFVKKQKKAHIVLTLR